MLLRYSRLQSITLLKESLPYVSYMRVMNIMKTKKKKQLRVTFLKILNHDCEKILFMKSKDPNSPFKGHWIGPKKALVLNNPGWSIDIDSVFFHYEGSHKHLNHEEVDSEYIESPETSSKRKWVVLKA